MSDVWHATLLAWLATGVFAVVMVWSPGAINAAVGCGVVALVLTVSAVIP